MFKIVNGSELIGSIQGADDPHFYEQPRRYTEEQYKQLLIDSQPYFDGIEDGTISLSDNYLIYGSEEHLKRETVTGISVIVPDQLTAVSAHLIYVEHPIQVMLADDGYVFASSDGRHRFLAAQKYNLKLLVDVVEGNGNVYLKKSLLS